MGGGATALRRRLELYIKWLSQAVDEAKGLPWHDGGEVRIDLPLNALIPRDYIADENFRLEAYRRIAAAADDEELTEVYNELVDRYGSPVPSAVEALFEVAKLRRKMMERA